MPINCSEFTAYPLKITKFIAVTNEFWHNYNIMVKSHKIVLLYELWLLQYDTQL